MKIKITKVNNKSNNNDDLQWNNDYYYEYYNKLYNKIIKVDLTSYEHYYTFLDLIRKGVFNGKMIKNK